MIIFKKILGAFTLSVLQANEYFSVGKLLQIRKAAKPKKIVSLAVKLTVKALCT